MGIFNYNELRSLFNIIKYGERKLWVLKGKLPVKFIYRMELNSFNYMYNYIH